MCIDNRSAVCFVMLLETDCGGLAVIATARHNPSKRLFSRTEMRLPGELKRPEMMSAADNMSELSL
ncbi:hypothetical protein LB516_26675 [Mesorhizobium sp. CO1-1-7]|uniref:hypothetical protein n=1 Tax=Mesorhizobium sp. CO1-1-7 TaxID=2876632 RepID=UPI001CD17259|nr:hypothetical protein [Mesorhizobium sp. CO1-1-7]MBZ9748822.1 hypothetical protein [Mesorhizobium sp. CO1-1-7]